MTAYKEKDIILEDDDYFAIRVTSGKCKGSYEVYRSGLTHATRFAQIGEYPLEKALDIAKRLINNHRIFLEKHPELKSNF